jgi:hypothetical protein
MIMYTAATSPKGLAAQMTSLWSQQAQSWPMLTEGLAGLRQARTRSFHLDSSRVVA